jgi:proteasome lid subunit RPN8/RPN11
MNLSVWPTLMEKMTEHAKACYPREACGLLIGHGATGERFMEVENVLQSETAYEIDPARLADVFRTLRQTGEDLVAIVHSHPRGPATPSRRDIDQAYYPETAHIIVSLADPEHPQIQGFRIVGGAVYPIELHAIV